MTYDPRDDTRLQGQEKYLKGVDLCRRAYRQYPANPSWDHDHCCFCFADFEVEHDPRYPDVLHEGYCTLDEYHWICAECFDDFRERFEWRVVAPPPDDA